MKKYGKYEKQPEAVPAKPPKVKNVLLQTYFTSLLCLVLCVSMFFGTSYAWFTSEVENTGNEIYIGTLEAKFLDGDGKDLAKAEHKVFDDSIRWEPYTTVFKTLQVQNTGELDLKYDITMTTAPDGEVNYATNLEEIGQYFEVWVKPVKNEENAETVQEENGWPSYTAMTAKDSGWQMIDTLDKVIAEGKSLHKGDLKGRTEAQIAQNAEPETGKVDVALHMVSSVNVNTLKDDEIMGKKLNIGIKLVAYQANTGDVVFVDNAKDLAGALAEGKPVALAKDIKATETMEIPAGKSVTLDLNGHAITMETEKHISLITNNGTLIINDTAGEGEIAMIFKGEVDNSTAVNAIDNRGTMIVNGGKISNTAEKANQQIGYAINNYNGAKLTVNGGEIVASGGFAYDGIRLFCGSNETLVTINDGDISTVWAQNPTADKATAVNGTVVVNGGKIDTVYFERYTIVKVADGVSAVVKDYGAEETDKIKVDKESEEGYTIYSFVL